MVGTVVGIGLVIFVLTSSLSQFIGDLPQYSGASSTNCKAQVTEALTALGLSRSDR